MPRPRTLEYGQLLMLRSRGMTLQQIADQVGLDINTVKGISSRGNKATKAVLESDFEARKTLLARAMSLLDWAVLNRDVAAADKMMTQAAKLTGAYQPERHDVGGTALALPLPTVTVLQAHDGAAIGGVMLRGALDDDDGGRA